MAFCPKNVQKAQLRRGRTEEMSPLFYLYFGSWLASHTDVLGSILLECWWATVWSRIGEVPGFQTQLLYGKKA